MAIRLCKGKYKINKNVCDNYDYLSEDDNNKFIFVEDDNGKLKYFIYQNGKEYFDFVNFDDIYVIGKEKLKKLKIEYLPVIYKDKIYGFIYDDEYLDDSLNKVKELIVFSNKCSIFNDKYDEAIVYGYNELTYYLEKLFKKNNLPYQIIVDGKTANKIDEKKYFELFVEGNFGLKIQDCAFWKVHEEWLFDSIKPLYQLYNSINSMEFIDQSKEEIFKAIIDNKPFMIARVGNTELAIIKQFLQKKEKVLDNYNEFWLDYLFSTSGFFAKDRNERVIDKFVFEHIEAIENCDCNLIYGNDELAEGLVSTLKYIQENNRFTLRWDELTMPDIQLTKALKNKSVLIISPYSKDIDTQLKKIKRIYGNIYENINFKTYQCLETQLDNRGNFEDFFEALEKMENDISNIDFDVALICCGAYGYLLSNYIKKIGKISIELCSYLPNWFGIKIKRYCTNIKVNKNWNSEWIFPTTKKIKSSEKIEDNCYWE